MQGREFLSPARLLANQATPACWRGTVVHAYYALFIECREVLAAWGRLPQGKHNVHHMVRLSLVYATDADLKRIGTTLEFLGNLRALASYDMADLPQFARSSSGFDAIRRAETAIALLDAIDSDPKRRAAAIASLPP